MVTEGVSRIRTRTGRAARRLSPARPLGRKTPATPFTIKKELALRIFIQNLESRLFLSAASASFVVADTGGGVISPKQMPVIVVGSHTLLANTANQKIQIQVTGGQAVQGTDFEVQVADGGPVVGGTIVGPKITNVDLTTGTIFAGNNDGNRGTRGYAPQDFDAQTTVSSGTVKAQGLLGTITVSTVGFTTGTWQLLMQGTVNGDTDFGPIPARTTNGSISIATPPKSNASISGEVFNDVNGNGRQDKGDVGLAGWTVELFSGTKEIASQVTDKNGNYEFSKLAAGNYSVEVVNQPKKYKPTGKSLPGYTINLQTGKAATGNVFGEKPIA